MCVSFEKKKLKPHTVDFVVSLARNFERHVTRFAPRTALKLIARGKLTFDRRVVVHSVSGRPLVDSGPQ